jgi:hypothetical protein
LRAAPTGPQSERWPEQRSSDRDRGRKGLDGDVDQKPYRIFGILFEGALIADVDALPQFRFIELRSCIGKTQQPSVHEERIANGAIHDDCTVSLLGLPDQSVDFDPGHCTRGSLIRD